MIMRLLKCLLQGRSQHEAEEAVASSDLAHARRLISPSWLANCSPLVQSVHIVTKLGYI